MQCTLLIPHLGWASVSGTPGAEPALAHLEILMARSRHRAFTRIGWEAWLCQAFEVERQRDWPVAPLTLAMDNGDPGGDYWLRADPVHIRVHHNRLALADASAFTLTPDEAQALVDALSAHFEPEGLRFSAPHANRWYLRLATDPGVSTTSLDEAAGGAIDHRLPAGPQAIEWHRVLNEAQMLLHAHAVNQAREARGELPVNGVWLWGGGRYTAVRGRHFTAVAADETLALALAAHADIPCAPLPPDAGRWLAARADLGARPLAVLDALIAPARRGDHEAWQSALQALERAWIAPLIAALRAGDLAEIAVVAPTADGCHRFELRRRDLLRLWRTRRSIAHWLGGQ